jgi:hypothetical protein
MAAIRKPRCPIKRRKNLASGVQRELMLVVGKRTGLAPRTLSLLFCFWRVGFELREIGEALEIRYADTSIELAFEYLIANRPLSSEVITSTLTERL